jgi:S1-C subfamily serine protease
MKIDNNFKNKINKCVVRIIAEVININWNMPYLLEEPVTAQGTGFFINNDGLILTCAHVVDSSKNLYIEIPFFGSDKYKCEVLFIVPQFDIALIKCLDYKNKDFLELGDSDNLNVNSEVVVVGYPTSLKLSSSNSNNLKFTSGIISGQQAGLIQTDSAINPGNSGGPLFCNNKVIGINSSKLVGDSLENIGHAVPINNYKVIKNYGNKNIIYRPNLLFSYNNSDKNIIKKLTNGKVDNGIIVSKIFNYSPLKNTNIKKDSIITEINNIKIDNYGLTSDYKWIGTNINISILLNRFLNNETIKIKYYNNEKVGIENIKLEPFIAPIRKIYPSFENVNYFIFSGMILMNFCDNHIEYIDTNNVNVICNIINTEEKLKEKLYVSYIFPNSKVSILKNINKHNFVTKVNDINVKNINQLKNSLKKPIIINKIEYMKFEEKNGKSIILSVEDIIKEDILFSKDYKYELNEIHKKYIKKLNIK